MTEPQLAGLGRRLGSLLYESLTIAALLLFGAALATALFGAAAAGLPRLAHQSMEFGLVSGYFLWCWCHGGQTLAMKTWRIRVVDKLGRPLSMPIALLRYLLAAAGVSLLGLGLWWALVDRDRQFLHDRLAHTRLVLTPASRKN